MLLRSKKTVTDKLKKVQKQEFSAAFQKLYDRAKAFMYGSGAYFELKNYVFLVCLSFKISPKTFGQHCVMLSDSRILGVQVCVRVSVIQSVSYSNTITGLDRP
jgi:hypothetical protein